MFNDTNGVCFADYITSITFQHLEEKERLNALFTGSLDVFMLGVFAIIFTVDFSLQGVMGGSLSGSEVGGRRTCHGGSERVNARSFPVDFCVPMDGWVPRGFRADVSGRCCALLGPP